MQVIRHGLRVIRRTAPGAFALLLAGIASRGQAAETLARLLVPVYVQNVSGAFGSRWTSDLRAFADTDHPVLIFPREFPCDGTLCPPEPALCCETPPRLPDDVTPQSSGIGSPAFLLYTAAADHDALSFNLRIRDISEQAGSAGTEIPIVRESDLFRSNLQLINVPVGGRFRSMLRIYDADANPTAVVTVYILDGLNNILARRDLTLRSDPIAIHPATGLPTRPGYVELPIEPEIPARPPAPLRELRIQIEPRSPGLRFWAFVATTDNVTQQVTVVTPR